MGQSRRQLRSARRRSRKTGQNEASGRKLLFGLRVLPHRPLPSAKQPGETKMLRRGAQDFYQGRRYAGTSSGANRNSLRRQEGGRLSASAARCQTTAGGDALGRSRWLEGGPPDP